MTVLLSDVYAEHYLCTNIASVAYRLFDGFVGAKVVLGVNIILPKKALKRDNRYQQDKKGSC